MKRANTGGFKKYTPIAQYVSRESGAYGGGLSKEPDKHPFAGFSNSQGS